MLATLAASNADGGGCATPGARPPGEPGWPSPMPGGAPALASSSLNRRSTSAVSARRNASSRCARCATPHTSMPSSIGENCAIRAAAARVSAASNGAS